MLKKPDEQQKSISEHKDAGGEPNPVTFGKSQECEGAIYFMDPKVDNWIYLYPDQVQDLRKFLLEKVV